MTWFKVDDSFYRSRKVRKLGRDRVPAVGLWTLCGDWSADNLTDGFVPWEVVEDWDQDRRWASRLIEVALWYETEHDGEDGVRFHDWHDWQPTKEQVIQRRKADAERRARWREAKRTGVTQVDVTTASPVASQQVSHHVSRRDTHVSSRGESRSGSVLPDPTRPVPSLKEETLPLAALAETEDAAFLEFYSAYPRREDRKAAERAWKRALKANAAPQQVIDAARRYAEQTRETERRFIKLPSTWLNAGAYDNESPTPRPLTRAAGDYQAWRNPADQSEYDAPLLPPNPQENQ